MSNLVKIRWAVRGTLVLGVLASTAANVLAAQPHIISRVIAGWFPLALLVSVELISRVPTSRRWLAVVRLGSTAVIALVAAWSSYWHTVHVALSYGEGTVSAHLLPLSIDGLIIVASLSLVELTDRIRAANPDTEQVSAIPAESAVPAVVTSTRRHVDVVPRHARTLPIVPRKAPHKPTVTSKKPNGSRTGSVSPATVARVMAARKSLPDASVAEVAKAAKVSERTAFRALATSTA